MPDRLRTALEDRYRIEREIGAGGMATVYLARDLRHSRRVALKVLRPELAAVLGPERFLSEIQVTANLQHPHLLPLFDSGEAGGLLFYVMPFVEGESLRARLERERQLPVDEAIRIAVAVASALAYAHRHGVIHRDLKPENILLHDGEPLIADFGIALAVSNAGGARATQTGISLGTPSYMSPEQATGDRQVDARTDVYSLAAVTYEMLVGDPPHVGSTTQAVIAKVLTERPSSVRSQRESVPTHVDATLQRALAKLPADRFASAGEFGQALSGVRPVATPDTPSHDLKPPLSRSEGSSRRIALISAAIVGAFFLGRAATLWPREASDADSLLLEVTFSDSLTLTGMGGLGQSFAISPDGTRLAFAAEGVAANGPGEGGRLGGGIFLRDLSEMTARLVRGTEGWAWPVFSPDGEWILFPTAGAGLRKVHVDGGAPVTVTDAGSNLGASWGVSDLIVFVKDDQLWTVSANGGTPSLLAAPDSGRGHVAYRWPYLMPGDDAALITIFKGVRHADSAQVGVVDLSDGRVTELGLRGTSPRYLPNGYLAFARYDGSLLVAPFSLRRLQTTGPAVPVLDSVRVKASGAAELSVSKAGILVYSSGTPLGRLTIVDRDGRARPAIAEPRGYMWPRISPDGRRFAFAIGPPSDIWVYDRESATFTRLTKDGNSQYPEWTPDGRRVAYSRDAVGEITWSPWDGSGEPEPFLRGDPPPVTVAFGPQGSYLAARRGNVSAGHNPDIWIAPIDSPEAIRSFVATPALEMGPRVSPDGALLAYGSDASGRMEVYITPLPGPGPRVPISNGGGAEPVWVPGTDDLLYRDGSRLIAVTLRRAPELAVVRRDTLPVEFTSPAPGGSNYDVLPGGEILMVEELAGGRMFAVINWFAEVERRVGR